MGILLGSSMLWSLYVHQLLLYLIFFWFFTVATLCDILEERKIKKKKLKLRFGIFHECLVRRSFTVGIIGGKAQASCHKRRLSLQACVATAFHDRWSCGS